MKARSYRSAALFLGALAFAAALDAQVLDIKPSGWVAASGYWRPAAAEPFAAAGLRGGAAVDGAAGDAVGFRFALEGYSNLAGLFSAADWAFTQPGPLEAQAAGNARFLAALELKEAWIDFAVGDVDVKLGNQIFAWGLADGSNPTDNLNARRIGSRFVSTLDEQKIGTLAANLTYNLSGNLGTVQGVFMPIALQNRLPSFAMTIPPASFGAPTVVIKDDGRPEVAAENMEGGLRALFYLGTLSFSASWLDYIDRYPDFAVLTTGAFPALTVTITPEHKRIHQFGLDGAFLSDGYELRTEWALSLTEDMNGTDPATKNPYLSGVVQFTRSFLDGNFTASGAWAPRFVFNHKLPSDYSTTADQNTAAYLREYDGQAYAWENVFSLRLAAKLLAETLNLEGLFLAELEAKDWLATASASYNLADGLNLKVGGGVYGSFLAEGDTNRAYGTFSNSRTIDNDYLFIELRWSF